MRVTNKGRIPKREQTKSLKDHEKVKPRKRQLAAEKEFYDATKGSLQREQFSLQRLHYGQTREKAMFSHCNTETRG